MMSTRTTSIMLLITAVLFGALGCIKLDFFLFEGEPAALADYDFTSEDLDGIAPERITSELIPSREKDTKLHVIYVKRDPSELDPRLDPDDNITILFSHGNRSNMLLYWYRSGYFEDMGFNFLMYDYRGYGASGGQTTEQHIYEDVEVVFDYLKGRDDVGLIFSVGYSMGGGPAIWLCSEESQRKVAGCFTEAAFASTEMLIQSGTGYDFEGSWYLDVKFDNVKRIKRVTVPFMIMHGANDQRVSIENAEMLFDAVQNNNQLNRLYVDETATHRNVPIPSYPLDEEPREYSHPDEIPADLRPEFDRYKRRIVDFIVDTLQAR